MKRIVPYPLRAAKISVDLLPFGIWVKPQICRKTSLSEQGKAAGEKVWWVRWLWFQVSYSRWV